MVASAGGVRTVDTVSSERRDRGFTLVEVVVAIVLVGILAAVVVVGVGNLTTRGTSAACSSSLDAARVAATAQGATGATVGSFGDLVSSGALSLPSGVTVSGDGRRLEGSGWQLVLQSSSPLQLVCYERAVLPVLDRMSVQPAAAYSLRRLSAVYAGAAVEVRRSSDGATSAIGFTASGDLDTAALVAFVGSGSGFVTTWFDQTGNGRHKTQPVGAEQPVLVEAGVVQTMSGRPTVRHGAGQGLVAPAVNYLPNADAASANLVAASTSSSTAYRRALNSPNVNWLLGPYTNEHVFFSGSPTNLHNAWNHRTTPPWSQTAVEVFTVVQAPTNQSWRNGVAVPTGEHRGTIGRLGTGVEGLAGESMLGVISEIVEVSAVLSAADRQLLERDQGAYYGVAVA